jgi:hypothetical protein
MPDQAENDQAGLLPEPDATETVRVMMRGSINDKSWWRRLLPPSLISFSLHLFLLPFLLVITVTFADHGVGISSWSASDNVDSLGNDAGNEPELGREKDAPAEEERTVAVGTDKTEAVVADAARQAKTANPQTASQTTSGSQQQTQALGAVLSKDEQLLLELINKYRASRQVPALLPTQKLCDATHSSVDLKHLKDDGAFFGKDFFCVTDVAQTPQQAFAYWMRSGAYVPSKMGNPVFRYIGVKSGKGANNHVYFALLFSANPSEWDE